MKKIINYGTVWCIILAVGSILLLAICNDQHSSIAKGRCYILFITMGAVVFTILFISLMIYLTTPKGYFNPNEEQYINTSCVEPDNKQTNPDTKQMEQKKEQTNPDTKQITSYSFGPLQFIRSPKKVPKLQTLIPSSPASNSSIVFDKVADII